MHTQRVFILLMTSLTRQSLCHSLSDSILTLFQWQLQTTSEN